MIKTLPWEPKCLDAGYGWICAGAAEGQCALIRIADEHSRSELQQHAAAVDEQLPLDLEPTTRSYTRPDLRNQRPRSKDDDPGASFHTWGKDLVNSLAIHRMKSGKKGCEDETVIIST